MTLLFMRDLVAIALMGTLVLTTFSILRMTQRRQGPGNAAVAGRGTR